MLANYNTKERALQAAYKEQLQILFEKRINILKHWSQFRFLPDRKGGGLLYHKETNVYSLKHLFSNYQSTDSGCDICVQSLTVNDLLLFKISEKMQQSMRKDIETIDEEILIIAKKAGLFQVDSDLLNDLHKYIEPSNQFYNDYNCELLNM